MAQALTVAQITVKGRDTQGGHGKRLQWRQLSSANQTRLALGSNTTGRLDQRTHGSPKSDARTTRRVRSFLSGGHREHQLTVLQSLEAGDDTYQAVHSL